MIQRCRKRWKSFLKCQTKNYNSFKIFTFNIQRKKHTSSITQLDKLLYINKALEEQTEQQKKSRNKICNEKKFQF